MCSTIFAYVTNDTGLRRADIGEIVFEMPSEWTPQKPICTCYIGDADGDGKILRQTFCEEVLQPLLQQVGWGNIVIEVR